MESSCHLIAKSFFSTVILSATLLTGCGGGGSSSSSPQTPPAQPVAQTDLDAGRYRISFIEIGLDEGVAASGIGFGDQANMLNSDFTSSRSPDLYQNVLIKKTDENNDGSINLDITFYDWVTGDVTRRLSETLLIESEDKWSAIIQENAADKYRIELFFNELSSSDPGANLANIAGDWKHMSLFGEADVFFSVSESGELTGTDADGCSITGLVSTPEPVTPVYQFDLTYSTCTKAGAMSGLFEYFRTNKEFKGMTSNQERAVGLYLSNP